ASSDTCDPHSRPEYTMMRSRSAVLCVLAFVVVACRRDATFTEPIPAYAAIHWVHALPDTMQEAFRIVAMVSNAGLYDQNFRGANMFYQGIEVGARHLQIFNSSPAPSVPRQVMQARALTFGRAAGLTLT